MKSDFNDDMFVAYILYFEMQKNSFRQSYIPTRMVKLVSWI